MFSITLVGSQLCFSSCFAENKNNTSGSTRLASEDLSDGFSQTGLPHAKTRQRVAFFSKEKRKKKHVGYLFYSIEQYQLNTRGFCLVLATGGHVGLLYEHFFPLKDCLHSSDFSIAITVIHTYQKPNRSLFFSLSLPFGVTYSYIKLTFLNVVVNVTLCL